jgi:hypothetical protein
MTLTLRAIRAALLVVAIGTTARADGLWCVVGLNVPTGGFTACYPLTDADAGTLPRNEAGSIDLVSRSTDDEHPGIVNFDCFKKREQCEELRGMYQAMKRRENPFASPRHE